MTRRSSSQSDGTLFYFGLAVLLALAILYFLATLFLTWSIYASFACFLAAWTYVELSKPPQAAYPNNEELSQENNKALSLVAILEDWEKQLREEKAHVYRRGDELGISRRIADGRFDARHGKGHSLNDRLSQLDQQFEATAEKICSVRTDLRLRKIARNDKVKCWQTHRRFVLSARMALIAYVIAGLVFAITPWSTPLSNFVSTKIWIASPIIRALYGPLSVAATFGIIAGAYGLYSNALQATRELDPSYFADKCARDIAEFKEADKLVEPDIETEFVHSNSQSEPENDEPTTENDHILSPYEVLGIGENASREEIVSAHRQLVKQYHPDLLRSLGPKLQKLGHEETQILNRAKDEALKRL
jgi:hypothetical protein